ncbi:MAG: protein kinase [Gemmataceae bacterium]
MPAPTTTEGLLDLIRKSNLVDPARLDAYLASLREDESESGDPLRLASRLIKDGLLTKFQAQQLLKGRYRNFTIVDKYKILEPLGQGGMSKVFLVEHLAMGHRVAMKILPISGTKDDPSLIARFKREAKAVAALNHPNVIRAHDISEGDRFHYIIMDYVEGVNLHDLVRKRGPLDPADAAHFIYQTAVGLQHIHDAGLIHRDIKPGNLLVDRAGVVKILDLGLARFESDGESLTKKFDDKAILGTADYLAPEQALDSQGLDARADIYGLGATFYFLLAGRAPFEEERNVAKKLLGHQMRTPESIASLRADVPPELLTILDTMMAKKPEDRFQSAGEVAEALSPWADVDVPLPSDDELPRRSLASQGSSGHISRGSRGPGSKAPSTVRRGSASAVTELPTPGAPMKSRPLARPSVPATPGFKRWAKNRLIAGIAAGVVAIIALPLAIWWLWPTSASPSVTPPAQTKVVPPKVVEEPKTEVKAKPPAKDITTAAPRNIPADALFVSGESKPNAFPNLAAAVAAVTKDGATIVVQRPLTETVTIGADTAKNLTILAASSDGSVTWKAGVGADSAQPLLRIAACDGLTVSGFTFDGESKFDTLIAIDGTCAGLKLDGLMLQGAKSAFVRFGGANGGGGTSDRPARLTRCRLVTPRDVTAGNAFESPKAIAFVEIEQSRIEGPFQSGILFAGPIDGVTVQQNRLYAMADGLRYAPYQSKAPLRVAIVGNTFYQMPRGIGFRELPPAEGSHATIQNNVFLDVEQLAMVDNLTLAPAEVTGQWIWLGEDMKPTSPVIPPKQPRYFRKVFDLTTLPFGPVTLDIACDESFGAYVNGEKVSEAVPEYFNERVYSLDVTKHLKLGKNVVAVQGVNQLDGLNANFGSTAGFFAQLTDRSDGGARLMASTDDTWKASKSGPEGWNTPPFDDAAWTKAKPWGALQIVWPWTHVTWDAVVDKQLAAKRWKPLKLTLGGNIRNYASWEGYPILDALRGYVDDNKKLVVPRDPADPQFLMYPPSHGLFRAGIDKKPAGVPGK